jgi:hypothetical protein
VARDYADARTLIRAQLIIFHNRMKVRTKTRRRSYNKRQKQTRRWHDSSIIKKATSDVWTARMLRGQTERPVWRRIMHKGGADQKTVEQDGYQFMYTEQEDSILCMTRRKSGICFKIDFGGHDVGISIGYHKDCAINKDMIQSEGTNIMLKLIIKLILTHRDVRKFRRIIINDNATVLDEKGRKIVVADMSMICTGCTWYSSLVPMFPEDPEDEQTFIHNRQNLFGPPHTEEITGPMRMEYPISFERLMEVLPSHISSVFIETLAIIGESYDLVKHLNASVVLNKIRAKKTHSSVFHDYMKQLMQAFNITSLYGMAWCVLMENGKILAQRDETHRCIKKTQTEEGLDGNYVPSKYVWMLPETFIKYIPNEEYEQRKAAYRVKAFKETEGADVWPDQINQSL